jgi:hypothetical protein
LSQLCHTQESQGIDAELASFLAWLTPVDYASQQSDFSRLRQEGTGQWLLESPEFNTWVENERQTIFCPGILGAGKTIITSVVVENLQNRFRSNPDVAIAYIYCNFRRQFEQNVEELFLNILKQFTDRQPFLPPPLKTLYDDHKKTRTRPSLPEIFTALQFVISMQSKALIIIDAIDECQSSDGCRTSFLSGLFNLQKLHKVNLLVTSRFIPEIIDQFQGCVSLEIRARSEDVNSYLEGRMGQLPSFVHRNRGLRDQITNSISDAVDGMYV